MTSPPEPVGWVETSLGELVDALQYGLTASADVALGGPRFLRITDIEAGTVDWSTVPGCAIDGHDVEKYRLETNDIVFARTGSIEKAARIVDPPDAVFASYLIRGRPLLSDLGPWLGAFVGSYSYIRQAKEMSAGIGRANVNAQNLAKIRLVLPPLPEQQRIVDALDSYLSRLDAAVGNLERVQAKLKAYRASVLKAAVEGRLVPTEAEVARQEKRAYEPAEALLARILKDRRRRWEDAELARLKNAGKAPKDDKWKAKYEEPSPPDTSKLPELPEGWCWTTLGQAFTVTVGATPSRGVKEYWNGNIPWVSSGEVAFCRISDTAEKITEAGLENSSTKMNPKGSVLVGMIGEGKTRGQPAILGIDACGNQNAAAIWVSETEVPTEYVYHYMVGQYEQTRRRGSGNNQPALNKSRVEAIPLPLAPLAEQQRIVAKLENDESVIANTEESVARDLKRVRRLRQAVLKWAFEGNLVDQDPADEPADKLLARIRADRNAAGPTKKTRGRKAKAAS